ncbi:MAG: peptide deformylase, partial [Elusimicrobia bacterium]|nr:peptide deformylase [Elusimicrobiota bacterium]
AEEALLEEGCLSVPTLRAEVPRAVRVKLSALDREGKLVEVAAEGFLARIFQHECDHLAGRLFLKRIRDLSTVKRARKV